jgi:hypothetical protein
MRQLTAASCEAAQVLQVSGFPQQGGRELPEIQGHFSRPVILILISMPLQ